MKIKAKLSTLDRVCRVLDSLGIVYLRANVEAVDKVENKKVQTQVIIMGAVFSDKGEYLFAAPVVNPMQPGPNHQ